MAQSHAHVIGAAQLAAIKAKASQLLMQAIFGMSGV